mmetsp:Transcript_6347/g.13725  ORF Transcript_6347/g.13725 Transcript_6347/m.13725 type:complete len:86 (-) Transcript_6347:449-706(-)
MICGDGIKMPSLLQTRSFCVFVILGVPNVFHPGCTSRTPWSFCYYDDDVFYLVRGEKKKKSTTLATRCITPASCIGNYSMDGTPS